MKFSSLGLLVVLIVCGRSAAAQDSLAWKFEKGQLFFVEERIRQEQTIVQKTADKPAMTETSTTDRITVNSFRVLGVGANGTVALRMEVQDVRQKATKPVSPDSKTLLNRMKGAVFLMRLEPDGTISDLRGYEDFVKRVSRGNAALAASWRSVVTEEFFRNLIRETFTVVPNKPQVKGDTWSQELSLSLGPLGSSQIRRTYQHAGIGEEGDVKDVIRLAMKGEGTLKMQQNPDNRLSYSIEDSNLKMDRIQGSGAFDPVRGRLLRLSSSYRVTGEFTLVQNGVKTRVQVDKNEKHRIRVLDNNPIADK